MFCEYFHTSPSKPVPYSIRYSFGVAISLGNFPDLASEVASPVSLGLTPLCNTSRLNAKIESVLGACMISFRAQATKQTTEIELRVKRNERDSESKRMERLRIKLKQVQQGQTQMQLLRTG